MIKILEKFNKTSKFWELLQNCLIKILKAKTQTQERNKTNVEKQSDPSIFDKVTDKKTTPFLLSCPIKATDENGNPVNAYTVKISAVLDHSGTAIDPNSKNRWGKNVKDQKVKAFNGEIGDTEPSFSAPFGYSKMDNTPFLKNKINYIGVYDPNDKYKSTHYLNYDGHAGYDFPYQPKTPVVAPANGRLFKAANGKDMIYGANWDKDHSFYIEHENGFITWFRHCEKINNSFENEIGNDFSKSSSVVRGEVIAYTGRFENWKADGTSPHLHFEVRDKDGRIIDPYKEKMWSDDS